jgi:HD-like signal output (HDOD) protein
MIAIDRYLDRIESLPPAPTVAIQLLELLSDPDRDIDHIVELIKYDPSLTAATLKRCNSGALSGAEPAALFDRRSHRFLRGHKEQNSGRN